MTGSAYVSMRLDTQRLRDNVLRIAASCGVRVYPVIKADGYGAGAAAVAEAVADLVEVFCVFSLREAVEADLWKRTGRPAIAIGPPDAPDPRDYLEHHVRPSVSTPEQAAALRPARPVLCVDTGMQRFACPAELVDAAVSAGDIDEAFTHATRLEHVRRLVELTGGRRIRLHAAASSLLDEPEARLDAVRPGLAIYRGAVRVAARLVEVRRSRGPVGYGGFTTGHHGVILCGYSRGLRRGPCMLNGRRSLILEVGMQSAYVEAEPSDRAGDEVVLLGEGLEAQDIAPWWGCTPHEVLLTLCRLGR